MVAKTSAVIIWNTRTSIYFKNAYDQIKAESYTNEAIFRIDDTFTVTFLRFGGLDSSPIKMILHSNAINYSKRIFALSVICLTVILFACKDDDSGSAKCENGTFEMTLNGEEVTGTSFNNTLFIGSSAGVDGKRVDIRATGDEGRQVIITFTDNSDAGGNCVSTDDYIPFDEIATGTENTFLFTIIDDGVSEMFTDGELDISSCDADARKISGTFSFSFGDTEVTNGSFTDMCYTKI